MKFLLGLFQLLFIFFIARTLAGLFRIGPKHPKGPSGGPGKSPDQRFNSDGKNIADADYEDVQ